MTTPEKTTGKVSRTTTTDPVCGMEVEPGKSKLVSVYKGHSYWFCADSCRSAFEANPDKYLKRKPNRKRGRFWRWLDRMGNSNEQAFGCSGPKCH